ncbi:MAG: CcmD family protein [Acidobacteriota bacterium]
MSSFWYLVGGFVLAWAAVFAYVWSLARRASNLQLQLDTLQQYLRQENTDS